MALFVMVFGLFHRGISQSGTIFCPWALTRQGTAKKHANRLGNLLDCPTHTSSALVECLRKKDAVDIIATDREFQTFDYDPMIPFRPVIEPDHPGAFIKEEPAQSLKSGNIADIPWMTGLNSQEGAIKVAGVYGLENKGYVKMLDEDFMKIAPMSLLFEETCHEVLTENITKTIRQFYFGDKKIDESTRLNLVDMYTDAWFYIAADNAVRDHLEVLSAPVYYYYFAYRGGASFSEIFGDPDKDYGVSHADELQYLFPVGEQLFKNTPLSKEDKKIIDLMTALWVNFATTGNPTPEKTPEIPIKWKPVRTPKLEYLHIGDSKNLHMAADLLPDRTKLWNNIPHRSKIEVSHHHAKDEL